MILTNTRVTLASRPIGEATPDCFALVDEPLCALDDGLVRVAVEYISVDAGTRTMLRGEGFHRQVGLGETILAGAVGRIVESAADGWDVGEAVFGGLGAQTCATLHPRHLERLDDTIGPLSAHLGVLGGSTGVTAWIGIRCVAKPKPGDTFVVSAAAGAVGSIAGQIAQRDGARVIGIAGGARKVEYLTEVLGFDAAIDYKHDDVNPRLRELAPDGVDVFFATVGGPILDTVLDNLAMRAKVVICGAISQYDVPASGGAAVIDGGVRLLPLPGEHCAGGRRPGRMVDGGLDPVPRGDPRRHRAIPRSPAVHVQRWQHRQAPRQGRMRSWGCDGSVVVDGWLWSLRDWPE
jgi:NADPH-dependent curcumin reductase CurA